jgi:hypothetical protein
MRTFSRLLAISASLILALGILLLPVRSAQASGTAVGYYHVVSTYNAVVYVNGVPAAAGTTYGDGDVVHVVAGAGGYTVFNRQTITSTSTWIHPGSVGGATFQAIWIGDD